MIYIKIQNIILSLLFLLLLLSVGCLHNIHKPSSPQYLKGLKQGEIYAKQDAINYICIEHPFIKNRSAKGDLRKHINSFTATKSPEFIKGFSQNYRTSYRDYVNAYCD